MDIWNGAGFWDGGGGAIIGALLSFGAALFVLYGTRHHDERMSQRNRSLDVATDLFENVRRWEAQMRRITSVIRYSVHAPVLDRERYKAQYEQAGMAVAKTDKLCDEIADSLLARSMQLDDLGVRHEIEQLGYRFTFHGAELFREIVEFDDPFRAEVRDLVEAVHKSLDEVQEVLRQYLTARSTQRDELAHRIGRALNGLRRRWRTGRR